MIEWIKITDAIPETDLDECLVFGREQVFSDFGKNKRVNEKKTHIAYFIRPNINSATKEYGFYSPFYPDYNEIIATHWAYLPKGPE